MIWGSCSAGDIASRAACRCGTPGAEFYSRL